MRKHAFYKLKNKGADQLSSNSETDQCLCFCYIYIVQSLYFLNPKFRASSYLLWLYSPVLSDLVGNHEDGFLYDAAHLINKCWP